MWPPSTMAVMDVSKCLQAAIYFLVRVSVTLGLLRQTKLTALPNTHTHTHTAAHNICCTAALKPQQQQPKGPSCLVRGGNYYYLLNDREADTAGTLRYPRSTSCLDGEMESMGL